jgi:hypothetical protein
MALWTSKILQKAWNRRMNLSDEAVIDVRVNDGL